MKRNKVTVEFMFRASPTILFQFLTNPACQIRWFCDEADEQDDHYYFSWSGSVQVAEIQDFIEDERLRLRWLDAEDPKEFLEYKISRTLISEETVLEVIDFCDEGDEKDTKTIWETSLKQLKFVMGG
jgi:uncharacterized protein YndB with AHSA1/START domain